MEKFTPFLDILPWPQKRLWTELAWIPKDFVLYGGTAIALYLNHRQSNDFDFFSSQAFDPFDLKLKLDYLGEYEVYQFHKNSLTISVDKDSPVKISFFGNITVGRLEPPLITSDQKMLVASKLDLLAHKLKVILQRVEAKDYIDIAALIEKGGISLETGLAGVQTLWPNAPVPEITRALSYFKEGDFQSLSAEDRRLLINKTINICYKKLKKLEIENQDLSFRD
ncbi:MAG TPA: nucleotidyl transferase AbiEii/AbiGii toxin family protein [Desulfohalobiaceae bacterium]|nr:nucleotidyl transferase AbiEii/AbiGii toxin family protein [Desulfohalobiaceae bacterium]